MAYQQKNLLKNPNQPDKHGWIKLDTQAPPLELQDQSLLVVCVTGRNPVSRNFHKAQFDSYRGHWRNNYGPLDGEVTHYMVVKLPEEE